MMIINDLQHYLFSIDLGALHAEMLIPDHIVDIVRVSDDGKYLLASVSYPDSWEEGVGMLHVGLVLIDLQKKEQTLFETAKDTAFNGMDGYENRNFVIRVNVRGDRRVQLLDPVTKTLQMPD